MTYDRNGNIREEEGVDTMTFGEILNEKVKKEEKKELKRKVSTPTLQQGYENMIDGYRIIHQMNNICDMRIFRGL